MKAINSGGRIREKAGCRQHGHVAQEFKDPAKTRTKSSRQRKRGQAAGQRHRKWEVARQEPGVCLTREKSQTAWEDGTGCWEDDQRQGIGEWRIRIAVPPSDSAFRKAP